MLRKNILSITVALIILYLSIASSKSFDKVPFINIPHLDKIIHFLMYFGLMTVMLYENRKSLSGKTQLFFLALIPFSYGILMEILQKTIASGRSANIYDVFANLTGIIVSALLWSYLGPRLNTSFK